VPVRLFGQVRLFNDEESLEFREVDTSSWDRRARPRKGMLKPYDQKDILLDAEEMEDLRAKDQEWEPWVPPPGGGEAEAEL
jgi:hypothetical protein